MESPQALIAPLKGRVNKSSSDDRPGPGICGSKYVEDAKAARSVRVWDRVPMKNIGPGGFNRASSDSGPKLAGRESQWRWKARRP